VGAGCGAELLVIVSVGNAASGVAVLVVFPLLLMLWVWVLAIQGCVTVGAGRDSFVPRMNSSIALLKWFAFLGAYVKAPVISIKHSALSPEYGGWLTALHLTVAVTRRISNYLFW